MTFISEPRAKVSRIGSSSVIRVASLYLALGGLPFLGTAQASRANLVPQSSQPFAFEVVSIRPHQPGAEREGTQYLPDGYKIGGVTIAYLLQLAYMPSDGNVISSSKILNAPAWLDSDLYDIDGRVALEDQPAWQKAQTSNSSTLLQQALLAALKDRSQLAVHITADHAACLDLVAGPHGAKLTPTVPGAIKPIPGKTSAAGNGFYIQDNGKSQFVGVTMAELARVLTRMNRFQTVADRTGIAGRYDFTVPWYSNQQYPASEISNNLDRMPIAAAGLALKPGKTQIIVINIDHVEKPDPN